MTETELPEGSQLQLVSLTTSTVTAQLEQLAAGPEFGNRDRNLRNGARFLGPVSNGRFRLRFGQAGRADFLYCTD